MIVHLLITKTAMSNYAKEEVDAHSCVFSSRDMCGKQFGTIQLVQAHTRVVCEDVGVHSCEMCGKYLKRVFL